MVQDTLLSYSAATKQKAERCTTIVLQQPNHVPGPLQVTSITSASCNILHTCESASSSAYYQLSIAQDGGNSVADDSNGGSWAEEPLAECAARASHGHAVQPDAGAGKVWREPAPRRWQDIRQIPHGYICSNSFSHSPQLLQALPPIRAHSESISNYAA